MTPSLRLLLALALAIFLLAAAPAARASEPPPKAGGEKAKAEELAFFEAKIRPVLESRCLECHSSAKKKGDLALDFREGMLRGGETGPAVVPGQPGESLLVSALKHENFEMPPNKQLPQPVIADFVRWIERGAIDPRDKPSAGVPSDADWERLFQARLKWWSLQPVAKPAPPATRDTAWPRTDVDRFVLQALEARQLAPAPPADPRALARRLSFALVGLPPDSGDVEALARDPSPRAFEAYVDKLLASPRFGEHWARHWMDLMHYADTHGYEWDIPAKNAWRYRDYLVRAFNADVPYRQLVVEHLAGDLLEEPRRGPDGLNESIIGPLSLRLGERRHGDNASVIGAGTSEEALDNAIDTISKAFLGTTVACSQCHHHKLDAVSQHDYYALAGTLSSSRFAVRSADMGDRNAEVLGDLRAIKTRLRGELAAQWLAALEALPERLQELPAAKAGDAAFPASPIALWGVLKAAPAEELADKWQALAKQHNQLRDERTKANAGLTLLADFTREEIPAGWHIEGYGLRSGLVASGEPVVADEGPAAVQQLLPAGRWSHAWSQRLGGAIRGPLMDRWTWPNLAVGFAGDRGACRLHIVENALFPEEQMKYLKMPQFGWLTLPTKVGAHRVYLELATKAYNNNFPPRIDLSPGGENDPRSWLGVTRVYAVSAPADELQRFTPLFSSEGTPATHDAAAQRIAGWLRGAIERWRDGVSTDEDAGTLNGLLGAKLLPNDTAMSPKLKEVVDTYRAMEAKLEGDRTVGSILDLAEGRNDRLRVRGSYTDFAEEVPRGNIRLLGPVRPVETREPTSGRLELARNWSDPANPLTSRVMVNRVWNYLFGEGLVRTPDDFGHLGAKPSHPELLDWLAGRYVADGWSTKKLIRLLVTSAVWQQSGQTRPACVAADPDNLLWHHMPPRRLEAEGIRDSLLAASGRLDGAMFGPGIEPYRAAEDGSKRLLRGPLDGHGRRSLYVKMTLMEPPRFLALFNQPIPKLTVGHRDVTNVPDQSLAMLNDPFVLAMAGHWSKQLVGDSAASPGERIAGMFARALSRPASETESAQLVALVERSAALRRVPAGDLMKSAEVWQDAAHAMFNLKEFLYVP